MPTKPRGTKSAGSAPAPPSITQSASFYFGEGASKDERKVMVSDVVSCTAGVLAAAAGMLAAGSWRGRWEPGAKMLYGKLIPAAAGMALLTTTIVLMRSLVRHIETAVLERHGHAKFPKFGRKGLLISTSSLLFVGSCFYRAINVADEGAALCRSPNSVFNMPAAGRAVATVGEIALVVQLSEYISDTARRLGIAANLWSKRWAFTLLPVSLAECFSWTGLLTGASKFFCCEYVMWCLIAATWTWDAAELLNKSIRRGDIAVHASILVGALLLFCFNAFFEIPHFFKYTRDASGETGGATAEIAGIWECLHDPDSPIWLKRLPFFFCYFFGAAWSSLAISYRYFHRGRFEKNAPPSKQPSVAAPAATTPKRQASPSPARKRSITTTKTTPQRRSASPARAKR